MTCHNKRQWDINFKRHMGLIIFMSEMIDILWREVTKRVYFTGNERMLIAHDSNRLRFS